MTVARSSRSRHRERSRLRRAVRVILAIICLILVLLGGRTLWHDLKTDRVMAKRGVSATGHLLDTGCYFCRAVGVTFTKAAGGVQTATVSAIGPQSDATIALKYDPLHPSTVQPAHGVVEEEIIAGVVMLVGLVGFLRCIGLPRRRRGRRRTRVRARGGTSYDMHGHVRVLRD